MIARTWRGAVRTEDAAAYAAYIDETGMKAYAATPGNQGAYMLTRDLGELTEFTTLSFWDSVDAIRTFAGETTRRRSLSRGRSLPGGARRDVRARSG